MAEKSPKTILTSGERQSLDSLNYPTKPILFDAKTSVEMGMVCKDGDGIIIKPPADIAEKIGSPEKKFGPGNIYSFVPSTMFGLNTALVRAEEGNPLREQFEKEFADYNQAVEKSGLLNPVNYGTWVFYPRNGDLVQFAPEKLHKLALVASNSTLFLDKERKLGWQEVRNVFDKVCPAISGLSFGNNIGLSVSMAVRPKTIIAGDPAVYKVTNANRVVGLGYKDMLLSSAESETAKEPLGLRSKSLVFAEKIHSIDPFANVFRYGEVNEGNMGAFLGGNKVQPKATVAIEVCDSPQIKLDFADEARKRGIRLLRLTEAGSTVRVDNRPFDENQNLPLTIEEPDQHLYDLLRESESSREGFFRFAGALIGKDHLERSDEFAGLVTGKLPKTYASVPQLGSTAMAAGGWGGELVARIALGYKFPERFVVDLTNLTIETWGDWV